MIYYPINDEVQTKENSSRTKRLTELIRQRKWNHLIHEQKAELKSAILDNHELFILDKSELGLMKGPPAVSRGNGLLPTTGSRANVTEMSTAATRCISVCPQLYLLPPAKINVADPQPSRGPRYRYPEEAKRLIADMLQDMEDRQIIEK